MVVERSQVALCRQPLDYPLRLLSEAVLLIWPPGATQLEVVNPGVAPHNLPFCLEQGAFPACHFDQPRH